MASISSDVYVYRCKGFEVKVGMHQGSGLSPLLFVIVMKAISTEFRVALPWELLYADDLAVIAETEEKLIKSTDVKTVYFSEPVTSLPKPVFYRLPKGLL